MAVAMTPRPISELINQLISMSGGNAQQAAERLGTSAASLSRWRSGNTRPRAQQEQRLRALVDGTGDLVDMKQLGIWEPLAVKQQTYKTAIEVCQISMTSRSNQNMLFQSQLVPKNILLKENTTYK
jgi:chaperonin GroEL (HSP60 family)